MSLLEASHLIYLLPPFYNNLTKRLIKSPKLYFIDSSIVAFLTRQPSASALLAGSMGGAFFEGFIVTETYKILLSQSKSANLFFWRSHDGLEVDLLIEKDGIIYPVEIKKTATPSLTHCQSLLKFSKIAKGISNLGKGLIVCNVKEKTHLPNGIQALHYNDFFHWL